MAPGTNGWDTTQSVQGGDGGWKANEGFGGVSNDGWNNGDAGDGFTGGEFAPENISKHAGGGYDAPADGGCRICHEDGHFARDCPSRSNGCFNCGEEGHNKAECPNPRVEREFTGECRYCGTVGHRAAECPTKPAQACRICKSTDHLAAECTANRMVTDFANLGIPDVEIEKAWEMVEKADAEKEVIEIKKAILTYARAFPELTWPELETTFRENRMKTFLIAKKQEPSELHTFVNLQGKPDQTYAISFQFSAKPRRAKFAEGWPSSPEENMERLAEAGLPLDSLVQKCDNCKQMGHTRRKCTEEKTFVEVEITCAVCGENGHLARDYKQPRKSGKECRNCSSTDHIARECPDREVKRCKNCDEEDHIAKECPHPKNMDKVQCRNCDEYGHTGRECPKPTDWSRVQCKNCNEYGHTVKRCKQPIAEANDGFGNNDGGDGGFGNSGFGHSNDNGGFDNGNGTDNSTGGGWGGDPAGNGNAGGSEW